MKGFVKKKDKDYSLIAARTGFALGVAGFAVMFFGGLGLSIAYRAKADDAKSVYLAKNTEIVYELQKDEIRQLATDYENGELSFPEYSVALSEVQSEKYIKDKTEELMASDEEYQQEMSSNEKLADAAIGVAVGGGTVAMAGLATGLFAPENGSTKNKKKQEVSETVEEAEKE